MSGAWHKPSTKMPEWQILYLGFDTHSVFLRCLVEILFTQYWVNPPEFWLVRKKVASGYSVHDMRAATIASKDL